MRYCDFCGKSVKQVRHLVAGKNADICDECILLCVALLADIIREGLDQVSKELVESSPENDCNVEAMRNGS